MLFWFCAPVCNSDANLFFLLISFDRHFLLASAKVNVDVNVYSYVLVEVEAVLFVHSKMCRG